MRKGFEKILCKQQKPGVAAQYLGLVKMKCMQDA